MESQTHTVVFGMSAKQVYLSICITLIKIQNTFGVYLLKLYICNKNIFIHLNQGTYK